MLRSLLRLVVAAAVAWAAWHAGAAAWRQLQFSQQIDRIAQFGADQDPDSVRSAVMEAAAQCNVPVAEKDVRIRRQEQPPELFIDVSYTVRIEILPRYFYPWTFTASAHGWFVPGGRTPLR